MALQLSLLEKSDTTEELAVAREQASVAKATIAALHREKFELQNHVRNEQEKKQQGLEQGSQLKQELSLAQAESRSAQGMAIAPQSQAPGGEEQVDTLKRELAQAQGQASSTKATVAALHKELFDLQSLVRNSKLKEKEEGEHTLSAQNERLKAELRALRVELSKLQIQAITAQSPTSTELQEEVTCLKEKNTRLVQKCGSLQGELFAAQGMEIDRAWNKSGDVAGDVAGVQRFKMIEFFSKMTTQAKDAMRRYELGKDANTSHDLMDIAAMDVAAFCSQLEAKSALVLDLERQLQGAHAQVATLLDQLQTAHTQRDLMNQELSEMQRHIYKPDAAHVQMAQVKVTHANAALVQSKATPAPSTSDTELIALFDQASEQLEEAKSKQFVLERAKSLPADPKPESLSETVRSQNPIAGNNVYRRLRMAQTVYSRNVDQVTLTK